MWPRRPKLKPSRWSKNSRRAQQVDLIIPTYGRAGRQETLRQLLRAGLEPALVVQEREYDEYKRRHPGVEIHCLPDSIRTIAPTRQWILENFDVEKFCMVDDDLWFYHRREDDPTKLRDIAPEELKEAFGKMDYYLDEYPHVGFTAREGANRIVSKLMFNTRIMRVLGYNADVLRREEIRFDEMEVMEDFHVALSLLECGHENLVLNTYAHNQAGGSGDKGGCSHFRTPELQAANAHKLAELHPDFVKVTQKTTKGAWGGGTRIDVTVQWKKAYASSAR